MYKVGDLEFDKFEELIKWAWDTHKLEYYSVDEKDLSEDGKQRACEELARLIKLMAD